MPNETPAASPGLDYSKYQWRASMREMPGIKKKSRFHSTRNFPMMLLQRNSQTAPSAIVQSFPLVMRDWEHASAQFNMGIMHFKGQGVEQDFKEAVKWLQKAAEQVKSKGSWRPSASWARFPRKRMEPSRNEHKRDSESKK